VSRDGASNGTLAASAFRTRAGASTVKSGATALDDKEALGRLRTKRSPLVPSKRARVRGGDARTRRKQQRAVGAHLALDRLLRYVHLSSERTLEPVRQDGSFAEKQQSHGALLFLVPCACLDWA
jgi:hypothetical protein